MYEILVNFETTEEKAPKKKLPVTITFLCVYMYTYIYLRIHTRHTIRSILPGFLSFPLYSLLLLQGFDESKIYSSLIDAQRFFLHVHSGWKLRRNATITDGEA